MRPPTTTQLSRMQDANEAAMWDTCHLVTRSEPAPNAYGEIVPQWIENFTDMACGLDQRSSYEVLRETQTWMFDAQLRLPIATVITNVDRIKITKRHGVTLTTALVYEIIGQPRRGPSGLRLELKTVTDGSTT
jgi:hypothetical protein